MPRTDVWTREQTIVAFNLYCSIPFGQAHSRNPEVRNVASLIGRTPGAVARKLGNFGSLDPELRARGVVGLGNRSKLDEEIWNEFHKNWNKQTLESVELIAKYKHVDIEDEVKVDMADLPKGVDKRASVKVRVYQDFFRRSVLAAYENKCCITGMNIRSLLVASHIKPWSMDEENRTNPQNGLCLNALHDRAFDKGLITVLPDHTILVSKHLDEIKDESVREKYFLDYNRTMIIKPHKFIPDKQFLEYHYEQIFQR